MKINSASILMSQMVKALAQGKTFHQIINNSHYHTDDCDCHLCLADRSKRARRKEKRGPRQA